MDDLGPLPVEQPATVAELGDLVRRAAAEDRAVYPLGGRTMLDLGFSPSRPGVGADLRCLNGVIDYPARDMTITVQAGMTVAAIQEQLAKENQRLPVDVPLAEAATIGGALATNASGPRRLGFGTLRDYVIGISAVNDEGHEIKAGGRVVKNVAGYDLCKLLIGSLGTLGIITQVTLKVRPMTEQSTLVAIRCPAQRLGELLDVLHGSGTRPVAVTAVHARVAAPIGSADDGPGGWQVWIGYEDSRAAVAWQVQQLTQELAGIGMEPGGQWHQADTAPIWTALTDFAVMPAPFSFKASMVPSATADFCRLAADLPEKPLLLAHAGSGVVIGHAVGALTVERAGAILSTLRNAAGTSGNIVVTRCTPEWKKRLPLWGTPRGDGFLMRAVKDKLDPKRRFNPGRFVEGI